MNLALVKLALLASSPPLNQYGQPDFDQQPDFDRQPDFNERRRVPKKKKPFQALPWLGAGAGLLGGAYLTRDSWLPQVKSYLGSQTTPPAATPPKTTPPAATPPAATPPAATPPAATPPATAAAAEQELKLDAELNAVHQHLVQRGAQDAWRGSAEELTAKGPSTPMQHVVNQVNNLAFPAVIGIGGASAATALDLKNPALRPKALARLGRLTPWGTAAAVSMDTAAWASMFDDPDILDMFLANSGGMSPEEARAFYARNYGLAGGLATGLGSVLGPKGTAATSIGNLGLRYGIEHKAREVAQQGQVAQYDGASMDMLHELYRQAKGGDTEVYPALQRWVDTEVNKQTPELSAQLLARNPVMGVLAQRVNALLGAGQNSTPASR